MHGKTFIDACLEGKEDPKNIDEWVNRWHSSTNKKTLHVFLGMTEEEYVNWVLAPSILEHIVEIRKRVQGAKIEMTHAVTTRRGMMN